MSLEVYSLLFGAFLGGLVSWLVTHIYHVKTSRDLRRTFARLPDAIQEATAKSSLAKLTVADLNAILCARVVDSSGLTDFPYKACPRCGSGNLRVANEFHSAEPEADEEGGINWIPIRCPAITCLDCGWSENAIDGPQPSYLAEQD